MLFTSDTVGRCIGDPPTTCKAAEKAMVEIAEAVPLNSAVIIAPHHGADNGSARCFIEAVDPNYVMFSVGHAHRHPRWSTDERYHLCHGVPLDRMFQTALGATTRAVPSGSSARSVQFDANWSPESN